MDHLPLYTMRVNWVALIFDEFQVYATFYYND